MRGAVRTLPGWPPVLSIEHNITAARGCMRIIPKVIPILLMASAMTGPLAAQEAAPRGLVEVREGNRAGFWGAIGIGAGGESFDLREGAGYNSQLYRPTLDLRLGGTISQHVRLGGEALAWINDRGNQTETLSSLLFVAQYYPVATSGLYLKGGLGIGRNEVDFDNGVGFGVGDTGFAGLLGAGWEIRVGRKVYLNPVIDLVQHAYSGRGGSDYRERLVNFGFGVVFQSGR
jgi:Outer membrane protein beta-barrel domain